MTVQELMAVVDHTTLGATATLGDIDKLCAEALKYKTASVCVNASYVRHANDMLRGEVPVCAVVGFPLGATTLETKVFEATQAIERGASEIDMVIHLGALKDGNYDYVLKDIVAVKQAIGNHVLKVIVEACLLTEEEKRKVCEIVEQSGADYIKTSTGFSTGGATFEDVALFKSILGNRVKIKAAGGIRTKEDMEKFLQLGADRLGTSSAVKILAGQQM